jgi:hypothetical protein
MENEMRKFVLAMSAVALTVVGFGSSAFAWGNSPYIMSPNGQYLGNLNSNRFDPNSVSNPFGRYGSRFSTDSVNNPFGPYGSPFSPYSINNPYNN